MFVPLCSELRRLQLPPFIVMVSAERQRSIETNGFVFFCFRANGVLSIGGWSVPRCRSGWNRFDEKGTETTQRTVLARFADGFVWMIKIGTNIWFAGNLWARCFKVRDGNQMSKLQWQFNKWVLWSPTFELLDVINRLWVLELLLSSWTDCSKRCVSYVTSITGEREYVCFLLYEIGWMNTNWTPETICCTKFSALKNWWVRWNVTSPPPRNDMESECDESFEGRWNE